MLLEKHQRREFSYKNMTGDENCIFTITLRRTIDMPSMVNFSVIVYIDRKINIHGSKITHYRWGLDGTDLVVKTRNGRKAWKNGFATWQTLGPTVKNYLESPIIFCRLYSFRLLAFWMDENDLWSPGSVSFEEIEGWLNDWNENREY